MKKLLLAMIIMLTGCTNEVVEEIVEPEVETPTLSIKLNGPTVMNLELNARYVEKGAVLDKGEVLIEGEVNTRVLGEYILTYSDIDKSVEVKRTVHVVDTIKPSIKLKGSSKIDLIVGDVFKEPGYSMTDADKNTTMNVYGEVGTEVGTYTITYEAIDSSGNTSVRERVVNIIEKQDEALTYGVIPVSQKTEGVLLYHDAQKMVAVPYDEIPSLVRNNDDSPYVFKDTFIEIGENYGIDDYVIKDDGMLFAGAEYKRGEWYPVIVSYDSEGSVEWEYKLDKGSRLEALYGKGNFTVFYYWVYEEGAKTSSTMMTEVLDHNGNSVVKEELEPIIDVVVWDDYLSIIVSDQNSSSHYSSKFGDVGKSYGIDYHKVEGLYIWMVDEYEGKQYYVADTTEGTSVGILNENFTFTHLFKPSSEMYDVKEILAYNDTYMLIGSTSSGYGAYQYDSEGNVLDIHLIEMENPWNYESVIVEDELYMFVYDQREFEVYVFELE